MLVNQSRVGWIKLFRILLSDSLWWYSSPEKKVIMITLLLMTNCKYNKWTWKGDKYIVQMEQMFVSNGLDTLIKKNNG